jgi:hypothetical protein
MRHTFVTLARNLAAGLRLASFRPLRASAFRITLGALLALVAFDLALDIAVDALRLGQVGTFNRGALQHYALAMSVMLVACGLLALAFRQSHLTLALAIAVIASGPLLTIAQHVYRAWAERGVAQWTPTLAWVAWAGWIVLLGWSMAVVARALMVTLAPRESAYWARVIGGTALLFGSVFAVHMLFYRPDWFSPAPSAVAERPSPVTEEALVRQPQLLTESLAALDAQQPGVTDLYFVGFGGDGGQDVFRKDVEAARAAIEARFDIARKSVMLVNNPDTLLTAPLATASNLRATLKAIASKIDRDEDAVMVFLTSHGSRDHRLAVEFHPLRLDQIHAADLRGMLDEAGIDWRIVVVSACYAGGFVPALADPRTLVMAAAAADRTSFGCSTDSEMTFFTEALFKQALPTAASFTAAFDRAHALVSAREQAEGLTPPSNPQLFVGDAMAAKLRDLEQRVPARTTAACRTVIC